MSVEKFLLFWSHYNILIIQGLLALVILLSLALAFSQFFRKKDEDPINAALQGMDTAQLEKTLQKILENQAAQGVAPTKVEASEASEKKPAPSAEPAAATGESVEGLATLQASLAESKAQVLDLQTQLQEKDKALQGATQNAGASAEAAPAADTSALMDKIRDLEARLGEYEIISEDIADLAKFRDENVELKKKLEAKPEATPSAEAALAAAAEVVASPEVAATPTAEPIAEVAAVPEAPASDVIDDELMKEFAAAVEGQKASALDSAATKAGDGEAPVQPPADETSVLMNDFESFVNKKT